MGFLCALIILALAAASTAKAQTDDNQVISVDSSIVVLNASIIDGSGKAVLGLDKRSFRIFEDGVEQSTDSFDAEETPFAAVILFDTSGSMSNRIGLARSATINFLRQLRVSDAVAIYRFDNKVSMVQDFSGSRDVSDKIFDLDADGATVLNDAVYNAAILLQKRPEKRKAIIVLSDGGDSGSRHSADKALRAALETGATIYTVDMSSMNLSIPGEQMRGRGALRNFAEKTGGIFIPTENGNSLRDALKRVVEELHNQYTLSYTPKQLKKDGKWHAIELRVSKPNLTIRTRKGYNAPRQNRER